MRSKFQTMLDTNLEEPIMDIFNENRTDKLKGDAFNTAVLISIAISLKRIADHLTKDTK
jgi:hypothetical protein